jgi:hypothetical protein
MASATLDPAGYWLIDILVPHEDGTNPSKFRAIIDNGCASCVSTYKIITRLRLRPIDFGFYSTIENKRVKTRIYSHGVMINNKGVPARIFRANDLPSGVDFIIGNDVLRHFTIQANGSTMTIT